MNSNQLSFGCNDKNFFAHRFTLESKSMYSMNCSRSNFRSEIVCDFDRTLRLIANKFCLIHLLIVIVYECSATARARTDAPIFSTYENILYCSARAVKKPNGFFQSIGSLQIIKKINIYITQRLLLLRMKVNCCKCRGQWKHMI